MTRPDLKPPFIWFGGKGAVVDLVWSALGNPPNYVEPFAGTLVMLLNRPGGAGKIETVNDLDCDVANTWRAMQSAPDEVARWADKPVNECEVHAWSIRLRETLPEHRERVHTDADYYDAKRAGIWIWGVCSSIGGNWMQLKGDKALPRVCGWVRGNGINALPLPSLGHSGRGVHSLEAAPLIDWFAALSRRLRRVRVASGDWQRVLSGATTGASNSLKNMGMSPCGVFLDPPYGEGANRKAGIYQEDSLTVAAATREWAIANGDDPHFRIVMAGYEGEHTMPASWQEVAWKAQGGHANRGENANRHRERLWFSPHCLQVGKQRELFSETRVS